MSTEKIDAIDAPLAEGFVSEGIPTPGTVVVQGNDYVQHGHTTAGQSHLCCGCCCDTRRAVIVVNIISLALASLAVLSLAVLSSEKYAAQFDDDEMQAALDELDGVAVGVSIGVAVLGMLCNAAGLIGAFKFNNIGIIVAAIWYAAECLRSLFFFDLAGAIMAGFFAYPHIVFYQEMKRGIMTPGNYQNEEKCCVC